jgi:hypothetical protein
MLDGQVEHFLAFLRAFDLLGADTPRPGTPRRVILQQVVYMARLFKVAASRRSEELFPTHIRHTLQEMYALCYNCAVYR